MATRPDRSPRGLVVPVVGLVVVLALCAGLVLAWDRVNPFGPSREDRTGEALVTRISDLSEYHAASGHYEVVVDIAEDDQGWVPDVIDGDRVLYVGKGEVDAIVDLGDVGDRVTIDEEASSATIHLPAPTIADPTLDLEESYVASHDQGIATRFDGSQLEVEAQRRAVEQIRTAAGREDMLLDRAEANTTDMLTALFESAGYEHVTVTYDE